MKKIQLPYINKFKTIWEYKKSFHKIDFISFIGWACPICGKEHCYRRIKHYWRKAKDLFPKYHEEDIPIARFLCRGQGKTFSLLPTQLIPYYQYTLQSVIGVLLLGLRSYESGQRGFYGAAKEVDPGSYLTPWLVAYWLKMVIKGFRRAHVSLRRWYDTSSICSRERYRGWEEVAGYFLCLDWQGKIIPCDLLEDAVNRYSGTTKIFLFGTASQARVYR